jgi:hypothetical protein
MSKKYTLNQLRGAWGAGASRGGSKTLPAGLFFHTWTEDRQIDWQGLVLKVEGQMALVQLFRWTDGTASEQRLVTLDAMRDWSFYGSVEEMRIAYCHYLGESPTEIEASERFIKFAEKVLNSGAK